MNRLRYCVFAGLIAGSVLLALALPVIAFADEAPTSVGQPTLQTGDAQNPKVAPAKSRWPKVKIRLPKWTIMPVMRMGATLKHAPRWLEDKFIDWIDWKQRVDIDPRDPRKWRKKRDFVWGRGPRLDLKDLSKGDVLIFESKGLVNKPIDVGTGLRGGTHVAIYLGDGMIVHAVGYNLKDKKAEIQIERLGADPQTASRRFIVRRAGGIEQVRLDQVADFAKKQDDKSYSLVTYRKWLPGQRKIDPGLNQEFNCSELINQAYRSQGIFLRTGDDFVTPNNLLQPSTKYLEDIGWSEAR